LHNLYFLQDFMRKMRTAIIDGTFQTLRREFLANYHPRSNG